MKYLKIFILFILIFLFAGCKKEEEKKTETEEECICESCEECNCKEIIESENLITLELDSTYTIDNKYLDYKKAYSGAISLNEDTLVVTPNNTGVGLVKLTKDNLVYRFIFYCFKEGSDETEFFIIKTI